MSEEELYNNIVEILSKGDFLQINGKPINLKELNDYINSQQQEIERLNNIIKPKEVNYNYLKLLFEKKDKEEVIKSYVYKCEQLEKLYKSYEEKEIEAMKKDNIINELEKELDLNLPFRVIGVRHLKNKLQELKGRDE